MSPSIREQCCIILSAVPLAPVDVFLQKPPRNLLLSWRPSPYSELFEMKGFKILGRPKNSQEWTVLESSLDSSMTCYQLPLQYSRTSFEYKVMAVHRGKEDVGTLAMKLPEPGNVMLTVCL